MTDLDLGARVEWEKLVFRKKSRMGQKKYSWNVNALDTETEKGDVRVVASQDSCLTAITLDTVLSFITGRKYEQAQNFFYNLHYDAECILKLDKGVADDIASGIESVYGEYTISYIPKKLLTIKKGKHHKFYYTDIAQFYRTSLANAAKTFLGLDAHEFKGDRARLFELHSIEDISKYCMHDAQLTKQLGELFLSKLRGLGLHPKFCISSGNLSQIYVLQNASVPHTFDIPKEVLFLYHQAYRGGWFDCYKRGSFNASQYDISSAYPHVLHDLPDLRQGKWVNGFDDAATLGVLRVKIRCEKTNLHALGVYNTHGVTYANFDKESFYYLTKSEFDVLRHYYTFDIDNAWCFKADDNAGFPYREAINTLYSFKQHAKSDAQQYRVAKEIINSLYGKTCEKIKTNDGFYKVGKLFNPVYAAEITAQTRMKIFKDFYSHREHIIAVHTDSVISDKPLPVALGEGLGAWERKNENENLVILRNGVYQFEGKEITARGFKGVTSLFDLFDSKKSYINLRYTRPQHLKECLVQDRFEDIGSFKDVDYDLSLNDHKRMWDSKIQSFEDLLYKQSESSAVPLSIIF